MHDFQSITAYFYFLNNRSSSHEVIMSDTLISLINITTSTSKIQIVQHNCTRNVNVMHSLLNSTMNKDIVLIQESWIFKDNKTTVSHSAFTTLLSSSSLDVRSWTVTFINKNRQNFVCTSRSDIFMNSDLQAITISINNSSETVLLLNIYNEKSQEEDSDIWTVERKLKDIQLFSKSIICSDFNAHHTWWNSEVEHSIRATVLT